jgi:hypothetical protein
VADAEKLLELAREARSKLEEGSREERRLLAASQLLSQLLLQDVERKEGKVQIRRGTSAERVPSVHEPEIRHGRKSASKRFDGHRLGLAVDTDDQLITAVDVILPEFPVAFEGVATGPRKRLAPISLAGRQPESVLRHGRLEQPDSFHGRVLVRAVLPPAVPEPSMAIGMPSRSVNR